MVAQPDFPSRFCIFLRCLSLAFLIVLSIALPACAQKGAAKLTPLIPTARWTVLHQGKLSKKRAVMPLDRLAVYTNTQLKFVGPDPKDPNRLGNFQIDGEWGLRAGHLVRVTGKSTALVLADADEFELQGLVDADGLGGWFILLGWHKGTGYALYNVTLKSSGSPWILVEFKDGKALAAGQREISRFEWKGTLPMRLGVVDQKLILKVGAKIIIDRHPLPNYKPGVLMIGTYDTQYGPKNVRIKTLRVRIPPKKRK